jgi:hypothetical protein
VTTVTDAEGMIGYQHYMTDVQVVAIFCLISLLLALYLMVHFPDFSGAITLPN